MSMFTPAGDVGRRGRALRPSRSAVTLALALALVLGAAVFAWTQLLAGSDDVDEAGTVVSSTPSPAGCAAPAAEGEAPSPLDGAVAEPTAPPVAPDRLEVTVLNASGQSGLASEVTAALAARGFGVGEPSNADLRIDGPALVRAGPRGVAGARAVWAHVPGATYLEDAREDGTVDLLVGASYEGLRPEAEAAELATAVPAATPAAAVPSPDC